MKNDLLQSGPSVRRSVRATLLATCLHKAVQSALTSKAHRKRLCLGICSYEYDIDLLKIDLKTKKAVFSYKENNIHILDSLLGECWDIKISSMDNTQFKFVTQLTVNIKEFMLFVCIFTAICRSLFDRTTYRSCVKQVDLVQDEDCSDHEDAF